MATTGTCLNGIVELGCMGGGNAGSVDCGGISSNGEGFGEEKIGSQPPMYQVQRNGEGDDVDTAEWKRRPTARRATSPRYTDPGETRAANTNTLSRIS